MHFNYNEVMHKTENIHKFIWIEAAIWFVIIGITVMGIRLYNYHKLKELNSYQIFMPDVDGVIEGSPVRMMGIQVGYVDKVKILSDSVYVKFYTQKDVVLPAGSIATVEFNGMGGSKSLEIYPPTKESIDSKKLIYISNPKRLHDVFGLLNDMFDKLGSITGKLSYFAKETGGFMPDSPQKIDIKDISDNVNMLNKWATKALSTRERRLKRQEKE